MGLLQHIFGGSGSDKSDKLRQQAIDAFNAVKTPELADLQVHLDKYVQQGVLTPEQAEAELLSSNAFNSITEDPSLEGAQKQALQSLQDVGNSGGLTAIDKARMNDITNTENTEAQGRLGALKANAAERGIGGSGLELASELQNEQSAADRAANSGTQVAADAQTRALQALIAAGQQAGSIRAQDYGEAQNKATAQNAIDAFNAQTLNATNQFNVNNANNAQAQNLNLKQSIADANTGTANQEKINNANANQTIFNDEGQIAAGKAGVLQNWANTAQDTANKEYAGNIGLVSGLVGDAAKAGATAFGGPVAGAAVDGGFDPTTMSTNKNINEDDLPSDRKLKKNIKTDDEAFEEFMSSINPKSFKYKAKAKRDDQPRLGVMAQDVEKTPVGDEMVNDTPDGKMIDKEKAISAALGSLKNLHKRVSTLEGK